MKSKCAILKVMMQEDLDNLEKEYFGNESLMFQTWKATWKY